MGVESGPSGAIATAVSLGPAISPGSAISAGIEASLTARFGPSITAESFVPSSPIIAEGPLPSPLAGFKPLRIEEVARPSLGGVFKPELNAEEAISEAESILSEARVRPLTEQSVVAEAEHGLGISKVTPVTVSEANNIYPSPEPIFVPVPAIEPGVRSTVDIFPKPEAKVANSIIVQPATQPQTERLQDQEVEEVVAEKVLREEPNTNVEEQIIKTQSVYLEDEPVSEQRRYEGRAAIKQAKVGAALTGLKKIPGWLVAKFMPQEHEGNRSQVVKKKGPDGSYQETVEEIGFSGEFETEQQVQDRLDEIVAQKRPAKKGKWGRILGQIEVARIFKYHIVKPSVGNEVTQTRIARKTVSLFKQGQAPVLANELPQKKTEAEIEENLDLSAVFKLETRVDPNKFSRKIFVG